eukprot:TRINITY_DN29854_c0_g1_i1.p1 TRINITY_DN29854_c0_g1~~TRINITY_DN29854_c0_g1_i1.p1  ORF type:complete len:1081 (-),score=163.82 TRINITY_DN29854_c0_g1_i1:122-3364(-)
MEFHLITPKKAAGQRLEPPLSASPGCTWTVPQTPTPGCHSGGNATWSSSRARQPQRGKAGKSGKKKPGFEAGPPRRAWWRNIFGWQGGERGADLSVNSRQIDDLLQRSSRFDYYSGSAFVDPFSDTAGAGAPEASEHQRSPSPARSSRSPTSCDGPLSRIRVLPSLDKQDSAHVAHAKQVRRQQHGWHSLHCKLIGKQPSRPPSRASACTYSIRPTPEPTDWCPPHVEDEDSRNRSSWVHSLRPAFDVEEGPLRYQEKKAKELRRQHELRALYNKQVRWRQKHQALQGRASVSPRCGTPSIEDGAAGLPPRASTSMGLTRLDQVDEDSADDDLEEAISSFASTPKSSPRGTHEEAIDGDEALERISLVSGGCDGRRPDSPDETPRGCSKKASERLASLLRRGSTAGLSSSIMTVARASMKFHSLAHKASERNKDFTSVISDGQMRQTSLLAVEPVRKRRSSVSADSTPDGEVPLSRRGSQVSRGGMFMAEMAKAPPLLPHNQDEEDEEDEDGISEDDDDFPFTATLQERTGFFHMVQHRLSLELLNQLAMIYEGSRPVLEEARPTERRRSTTRISSLGIVRGWSRSVSIRALQDLLAQELSMPRDVILPEADTTAQNPAGFQLQGPVQEGDDDATDEQDSPDAKSATEVSFATFLEFLRFVNSAVQRLYRDFSEALWSEDDRAHMKVVFDRFGTVKQRLPMDKLFASIESLAFVDIELRSLEEQRLVLEIIREVTARRTGSVKKEEASSLSRTEFMQVVARTVYAIDQEERKRTQKKEKEVAERAGFGVLEVDDLRQLYAGFMQLQGSRDPLTRFQNLFGICNIRTLSIEEVKKLESIVTAPVPLDLILMEGDITFMDQARKDHPKEMAIGNITSDFPFTVFMEWMGRVNAAGIGGLTIIKKTNITLEDLEPRTGFVSAVMRENLYSDCPPTRLRWEPATSQGLHHLKLLQKAEAESQLMKAMGTTNTTSITPSIARSRSGSKIPPAEKYSELLSPRDPSKADKPRRPSWQNQVAQTATDKSSGRSSKLGSVRTSASMPPGPSQPAVCRRRSSLQPIHDDDAEPKAVPLPQNGHAGSDAS